LFSLQVAFSHNEACSRILVIVLCSIQTLLLQFFITSVGQSKPSSMGQGGGLHYL
jgi:hypothetical protein